MPTTLEKEHQLQHEIAPRVENELPGVDVLAVELLTPTRFRVYVDSPAGVDHALCQQVTDVLRDYLREYSVEVSSPGLDRPLRRQEHFEAALGRRVKLRTAGRRTLRGEVRLRGRAEREGRRLGRRRNRDPVRRDRAGEPHRRGSVT